MFNITHNVGDAAKERAENRGLSAAEILAKSAAAGADLGDQKLGRLGARIEQFEASREAAASRASNGAGHAKSPMSDDVERTLNQPTSFPVSDGGGRSLTQTAARLAMASASVVANFLPKSTPAKATMALDLSAGPDDDNLPGLTSDSDSDDDKRGGSVLRGSSFQSRVFGLSPPPADPAVGSGPRARAPPTPSMSLDLEDADDVSALSFGSGRSSHQSQHSSRTSSLFADGMRAGMDPPAAGAGGPAVDLSVAEKQLRELARAADAQVRTAEATEKRAETEGESLRMNQQMHELAIAKQNGTDRVHGSNDSKCMRMLVNSCAADMDKQPIAAAGRQGFARLCRGH